MRKKIIHVRQDVEKKDGADGHGNEKNGNFDKFMKKGKRKAAGKRR